VRILAVDPGAKRIGLALGDDETGIATPHSVVEMTDRAAAIRLIAELAGDRGAELVVIGLPTDVDGNETPACTRSRVLAAGLHDRGIRTALQPELLSSDEARRRARAFGRPVGRPVDDLAAQVILEEYLAAARSMGDAR
jgi:putative Holliday junction resolvase